MARISLVEQYDNKDVIQQIYMLKTATDGWEERISASEQASNEALDMVSGFDERIQAVADAQADVDNKIAGFDTRIDVANQTADNAVAKVDTLDRQVDTRIADQEVKGLSVSSAGTGSYAVTAVKQNGNVTSNSFNVSKVTSATIGAGEAQNSIYLQLNLSDGTTVRTNDTVISITGVEEDIHVTSIVLEDAPDAHTIKAIFTYNNGQSISSNTLTYDYPDIASSSSPGLVMGNDATGGVQVDGQGRMTVVGWDSFATQDSLEALEDEVGAVGQAGTIRNDLDILNKLTAFYGNREVINTIAEGGYQTDASNPNIVKYGFQYTRAYKDGSVVKNEVVDDYFIPIYSYKLSDGGEKTALYSSEYIEGLETTLQGGIDAVDARCDNISSTVSDHGTMLNAQAEAISKKQDELVVGVNMDEVPTMGSQNPVTSGGVYEDMVKVINLPKLVGTDLTQSSDRYYSFGDILNYSDYPGLEGTTKTKRTLAIGKIQVDVRMKDGYDPVYPTSVVVSASPSSTGTFSYSAGVQFASGVGSTIDRVQIFLTGMRLFLTGDVDSSGIEARQMALVGMQYYCAHRATANDTYSSEDFTGTLVGASVGYGSHFSGEWVYPSYAVPVISGEGGSIVVDTAISASSTNPVQNKVISAALDMKASTATTDALTQELADKQDKLTAGTGISIVDGVISVNLSNANGVSF